MVERLDRSAIIHIAYKRAKARNSPDLGNRFKLCREVALGARKLHVPDTRIEDSLNKSLLLSGGSPPLRMVRLATDGDLVPLTFVR